MYVKAWCIPITDLVNGILRTYVALYLTTFVVDAVWREMVAMQRRGTNVVVGGDRQKLGAKELDISAVLKRNRKQITAVLVSLTVFAVLLSKFSQQLKSRQAEACSSCNPCAQTQLNNESFSSFNLTVFAIRLMNLCSA